MKLCFIDAFLTRGSASIPAGDWVAVGIHPSSEVDLCDVGNYRLGVNAIVPVNTGDSVRAVRSLKNVDSAALAALLNTTGGGPADGNKAPSDKLVLQLYEACDEWQPPGPRVPYVTQAFVPTTQMTTTQATAKLIARVPFSGRKTLAVFVQPAGPTSLVVIGLRYPLPASISGLLLGEESPVTVVPVNLMTTGAVMAGSTNSVGVYYTENFDEMLVYVWTPGGAASVSVAIEAYGER